MSRNERTDERWDPPPFRVRVSRKTKRVSLKVSPQAGLEVVIPTGFDPDRIPEILAQKRDWLDRVWLQPLPSEPGLPHQIDLVSIGQGWQVSYQASAAPRIRLHQHPHHLILQGDISNSAACRTLLQHWFVQQGYHHLGPRIRELSQALNLPFGQLRIRRQKTRWGSCSRQHTINLNCKLLFLPDLVVRYVMVHELCHTRYFDHSSAFWHLVEQHEPNLRILKQQLRELTARIPAWIDD